MSEAPLIVSSENPPEELVRSVISLADSLVREVEVGNVVHQDGNILQRKGVDTDGFEVFGFGTNLNCKYNSFQFHASGVAILKRADGSRLSSPAEEIHTELWELLQTQLHSFQELIGVVAEENIQRVQETIKHMLQMLDDPPERKKEAAIRYLKFMKERLTIVKRWREELSNRPNEDIEKQAFFLFAVVADVDSQDTRSEYANIMLEAIESGLSSDEIKKITELVEKEFLYDANPKS